jgi:hypothetical protein
VAHDAGPSITDWITAGTAVIGTLVLVGIPTVKFFVQRRRTGTGSLAVKFDPATDAFSILRLVFKPAEVCPARAVIQVLSPADVEICAPKASTDPNQEIGPWSRSVGMALFNQPADTLRTDLLAQSASGAVSAATLRITIRTERTGRRLLVRVVTLT